MGAQPTLQESAPFYGADSYLLPRRGPRPREPPSSMTTAYCAQRLNHSQA